MLQHLTIDDARIFNYQLTDDQLQFTMHPKEANEFAKKDRERHLIGWMENGELPTFFVLHEGEGVKPYSDNPNAILLRSFSTDHRYVGRGYAKHSLRALPVFIEKHFPNCDEVVLTVNVDNLRAQSLYFEVGFKDYGVRTNGRNGELLVLSLQF